MAIYDWPTSRTFVSQTAELRVIDNTQRSLDSPMSGHVQTLSMPGARWGWGFDFSAHADADRAQLEAYLLRLSGRQHRVRLWDIKRPQPRGIIQMSGVTLSAAAAQFATTLQLSGCRGGNQLLGGSFEADSNSDGLADGWTVYSTGATGTVTTGQTTDAPAYGLYAQRVTALALSPTGDGSAGVYQAVPAAHLAGAPVVLSAHVATYDGAPQARLFLTWRNGATTIRQDSLAIAASPTMARYALAVVAPAGITHVDAFIFMTARSGGTAGAAVMDVDGAQLERGTVVGPYLPFATLLAGDWLGLATGQLVRVVADATADDVGRMTVDVRHMLRAAVASGSAVTLDRPTALYIRTEAGLMLPRMPGLAAPPVSAEFIEVFS